jgi:hypothetical protein
MLIYVVVLPLTAATLSPYSRPPFLSPQRIVSEAAGQLSPYSRPPLLSPRRIVAEGYALYGETLSQAMGAPVAQLGVDTEIRETARRGKGLFALRDIAPGELVARYSGVVISKDDFADAFYTGRSSGAYAIKCSSDGSVLIDAEDASVSGPGRYVNHSKLWKNCAFSSFCFDDEGLVPSGVLYVVAERAVPDGAELLVDYGEEYWSSKTQYNDPLRRFAIDYLPW